MFKNMMRRRMFGPVKVTGRWRNAQCGDSQDLQAGSGHNVLILLASCQQTCMTYTIAVCTVKNS